MREIHLKSGSGHHGDSRGLLHHPAFSLPFSSTQIYLLSKHILALSVYTSLSEIKADLLTVLTGNLMSPNTVHGVLPLPGKHRRSSRMSQYTQQEPTLQEREKGSEPVRCVPRGDPQGPRCLGACIRTPFRVDIYSASLLKEQIQACAHHPSLTQPPVVQSHSYKPMY